ncbi:hypothetical protein H0H92_010452 [Tricholoma furcatifolium]|nr:hypothetical protein H0H92_010452 [Tricholoma furcatifolium]
MNYIFNNFSTGSADGPVFGPRRRTQTEPHPQMTSTATTLHAGHLPEFDEEFAKLCAETSKEDKVLRFVGVVDVEGGIVKAGLEKYVRPLSLLPRSNVGIT